MRGEQVVANAGMLPPLFRDPISVDHRLHLAKINFLCNIFLIIRCGRFQRPRYTADSHSKIMKTPALTAKILLLLFLFNMANAGQPDSFQAGVIVCLLPIEHADAEELADVLAPFLSPRGKIAAYSPTNTLILKDQPSVVKMLVKVIKGRSDLSECQNFKAEGDVKSP